MAVVTDGGNTDAQSHDEGHRHGAGGHAAGVKGHGEIIRIGKGGQGKHHGIQAQQQPLGQVLEVLVEDRDEYGAYIGRTEYDAPEIDNSVIFTSDRELVPGDFVKVQINDAFDYDLVGVEV